MNIEIQLAKFVKLYRKVALPTNVIMEAKKRVLDSLACFSSGYHEPAVKKLRSVLLHLSSGQCRIWGTNIDSSFETAVLLNGAAVRVLDFNDTYLSKEPCHPSDLIPAIWAACEIEGGRNQGRDLIKAMVLGYEILCRLCDAASLRRRGWDHITYLPVASAMACACVFNLPEERIRQAISLAMTPNNALRQTRVGEISDWKAACAANAAKAGLLAALLSKGQFTGPTDIFSGRHGFFKQVSGPFTLNLRRPINWMILNTHTKYYPAEHHAQSAIEAAILLNQQLRAVHRQGFSQYCLRQIISIQIECFDVAAEIIGSEIEKWKPTTRETADHSLPYLVVAALVDGTINHQQFNNQRFLDSDIRTLLGRVRVRPIIKYSKRYPHFMPSKVILMMKDGRHLEKEILQPLGYAGRPMTREIVQEKFLRLSNPTINRVNQTKLMKLVSQLERVENLKALENFMIQES